MHEISPNNNTQKLLEQFKKAGGVVDYVLLSLDETAPSAYETHRLAAIESMRAFSRRMDSWFEAVLRRIAYRNHTRDDFKRIQFDESRMSAEQITLSEFLGPLFDLQSRQLLSRESFGIQSLEYFAGYAYAFSAPPYGLQIEAIALNQLFVDLADELFQGFKQPLTIWEWSTDWSNYFDAGHDWWGSHLWTIYAEGNDFIVGIGASSTD